MTAAAAPLAQLVAVRAQKDTRFARVLDALLAAPTTPRAHWSEQPARKLSDQRRAALVEDFVDGSMRTPQAQALLKLRTPQAVHRLRSRGKLVAGRAVGNQTWFPLGNSTPTGCVQIYLGYSSCSHGSRPTPWPPTGSCASNTTNSATPRSPKPCANPRPPN